MPSRQGPDDQSMAEAPADGTEDNGAPEPVETAELGPQRVRMLPGGSETAASFEFEGEDHTLGNALRYMIMKNPDVEFCGYSIPHPSEAKMNVRIQTYEGTTVYDALEKGFDDLADLCDVVTEKFTVARDAYMASQHA
ncbi:RNA polymerase subunit AC19 [Ptychographa xylographoides]|nr:RNA polymerase subunit AC19 [Ptychographa xylographoides]